MGFAWQKQDIGGKVIIVSACFAVVSMLMNWIDIGIATRNGFSQGTVLLLLLWIYHVTSILKNKVLNRTISAGCSMLSIVFAFLYIKSKTVVIFGQTRNVSAEGAWMFMLASIALVIGIIMHKEIEADEYLSEKKE